MTDEPEGIEGEPPYLSGMPSGVSCYHTEPDCNRLLTGRNPRPVSERTVEWHDLDRCPDCNGQEYRGPSRGGPVATDGGESA